MVILVPSTRLLSQAHQEALNAAADGRKGSLLSASAPINRPHYNAHREMPS